MCVCEDVFPVQPRKRPRGGAAFTLVELLVVIVIIGVLASISLSVFNSARRSALGAQCLSNVKQLAGANNLYAADHNGIMANDPTPATTGGGSVLYPQLLWPYVKPDNKYPGYDGSSDEPAIFVGTIFHCPELPNDKKAMAKSSPVVTFSTYRSYGMNYYMIDGDTTTRKRMINVPHPSKTMLFCDNFNTTQATPNNLAGRHASRCNVVYCDGHAAAETITASMRLSNKTDPFWGDLVTNSNQ